MKKRLPIVAIVLGIVAVLAIAGGMHIKSKFPYGRSHCCIKNMMFSLEQFAEENVGRYPAGESSPEASPRFKELPVQKADEFSSNEAMLLAATKFLKQFAGKITAEPHDRIVN